MTIEMTKLMGELYNTYGNWLSFLIMAGFIVAMLLIAKGGNTCIQFYKQGSLFQFKNMIYPVLLILIGIAVAIFSKSMEHYLTLAKHNLLSTLEGNAYLEAYISEIEKNYSERAKQSHATNGMKTPLNEPSLTDQGLLDWAKRAAVSANSYSYDNYRKNISDIQIYFTHKGYISFLEALEKSNNLDAVVDNKIIVSAIAYEPSIETKGVLTGIYYWTVKIPMEINYQGIKNANQKVSLTVRIIRDPSLPLPFTVGIDRYLLQVNP